MTNERIRQLIEQCTEQVYVDMCDDYDIVFNKEKFAELLIHECASICYNSGLDDSDAHAQNLLYDSILIIAGMTNERTN